MTDIHVSDTANCIRMRRVDYQKGHIMNRNLHGVEPSEEPACDYQQSQTFSRETFEALLALKSALEQQGITTPIGGSQVFEHVLHVSESIEHEAVQQARTRLLHALLPEA